MAAYLAELDASDANDGEPEIDPAAVQQALEVLRREHERLQCAKQHLTQGGARVTTTEPEARCMKGHGPAYNVQTVVDDSYHLISPMR